ncbi:MAG: hypothetical protein JJE39_01655 [Vicinamibacteria bacterium]|nr:hypothetical protein [Vicinamibacteria bacterium]
MRLLPRSLAEAFLHNEKEIFSDARTSTMPALSLIYQDLAQGRLAEPTKVAIGQELSERARALQGPDFRSAVIALGAAYRLAVDLPDPGIGSGLGADAKARAIRQEFYLFVAANRGKIPLVVVEPASLRMRLDAVPGFLASVVAKTSAQAALLRQEGHEGGRVLRYGEIDFRSPVFAVASTAYSRSVSVVAAVWIAIWRSAGGDMTRQKAPQTINPRPLELSEEN